MKPSLPKGTRDFLPQQALRRKYLFNIIESIFKKYGYLPIETPTLENLSTLMGKYGEEGDGLLFKVLNNGDFLAKVDSKPLIEKASRQVLNQISKRGLRYDLTIPFARFVVMHQNEINLPFKRYQIQPVWRADRPQKGRYQEFYQCDVDVVGSESLMYEAELTRIFDDVFTALGIKVGIKVNNRKVLAGIAEVAGVSEQFIDMTVAIDKIDKIGSEGVIKELEDKGFLSTQAAKIIELIRMDVIDLRKSFTETAVGQEGLEELETFYQYLDPDALKNEVIFDATLARGLTYYTGCIFEVVTDVVQIGSLCGGGRYADLTAVFGLPGVSGVGISFGAERIYDVLEELDLWPAGIDQQLQILLTAFDQESHLESFRWLCALRAAGIAADLYPSPAKFKKQMKYANSIGVKLVGIMGSEELTAQVISIKDMESGQQSKMDLNQLIAKLSI